MRRGWWGETLGRHLAVLPERPTQQGQMPYRRPPPCCWEWLTVPVGETFDAHEPHGPRQSEAGPGPERGLRCANHKPGQHKGREVDPESHGQPYTRLVAQRVLTAMMRHAQAPCDTVGDRCRLRPQSLAAATRHC